MLLARNIGFITAITLLFSLFTGCFTYQEVEVVKVTEINVENFSTKGIEIGVGMQIKNPNRYKISIVNSDLDLFVKGNKIGTAQITTKVSLPKKSNEVHHFTIQTSLENMSSNALPILMSVIAGNAIDLEVKGNIKAKAKGISKKFPVEFKEKIKL